MRTLALNLSLAAATAAVALPAWAAAAPTRPAPAAASPAAPTLATPDVAPDPAGEGVRPTPVVFEQQAVLPADGPYLLRLTNVRGRVVLKRWNKNVIWVEATVRASRPLTGSALEYFKAAQMKATRPQEDQVDVETIWRGVKETYPAIVAAKAPGVEVEYLVAVPPETAVEVRQEYGPIVAAGLDGRLDLFSRDGDVTVVESKGWVEAGNDRGNVTIRHVQGDAVARSHRGQVTFDDVSGDVRATTVSGPVRVNVPARWAGDVSFHTVSGAFRSDLATFQTEMEEGDTGYEGVMRGPLAAPAAVPAVRIRVDTTSGDVVLASQGPAAR